MARRFSAEEIIKVRELTAQGITASKIAKVMSLDPEVFRKIADFHGIKLYVKEYDIKVRDAWIRQWYSSMLTAVELVEKYRAEIDPKGTKSQIYNRATKLKVYRPQAMIERERMMRLEEVAVRNRDRIQERLALVQRHLDAGASVKQAAVRSGISHCSVYEAIKRGEVRFISPVRPPPKPRKQPRVAGSFPTIEAWLAAGNEITRCPTAAAHYTTGYISPEDRQALAAHAHSQFVEGNMWKAARRAHFDAIDRMKGKTSG